MNWWWVLCKKVKSAKGKVQEGRQRLITTATVTEAPATTKVRTCVALVHLPFLIGQRIFAARKWSTCMQDRLSNMQMPKYRQILRVHPIGTPMHHCIVFVVDRSRSVGHVWREGNIFEGNEIFLFHSVLAYLDFPVSSRSNFRSWNLQECVSYLASLCWFINITIDIVQVRFKFLKRNLWWFMDGIQSVYFFSKDESMGDASMKQLLGGKGANLAEMCKIGLSTPPGMTLTTESCRVYNENGVCGS